MTCRSVVVSVMLTACLFAGTRVADAKQLEAVASFTVLADMVHQVGGDRVNVQTLVGPNGDPHAFEPTPDDARKLKAADIVFVSGLGLEGWMDRLIAASGYQGKPVVTSRGVQTLHMQEDGKQITDPHAWNSAANGVIYVRNIVAALSAADPGGAATYQANGDRYAAELKTLDDYARQQVATVPAGKRKVLTSHDAFGVRPCLRRHVPLATRLSTESEPSAQQVAALIKQIKAQHVRILENSNDPRLVEQIARATGAQPGGTLYVEALSEPDGPAQTYAAMFRSNVDKLVAAMRVP